MVMAAGDVQMDKLLDGAIHISKDPRKLLPKLLKRKHYSMAHDDGWGIAYMKNGKWEIYKSTLPIFTDPKVKKFKTLKTNAVIVHTRFKTKGERAKFNTHPFHVTDPKLGSLVFCHNGTINQEIIHAKRFEKKGTTDSEQLFYAILTEILSGQTVTNAIRKQANRYRESHGSNIILSSRATSYISCNYSRYPEYMQMALTKENGMTVVSSEPLPLAKNWKKLKNGDIAVLNHNTARVSIKKRRSLLPAKSS